MVTKKKRVQLSSDKCKEMRISFTKSQQEFEPILINGDTLEFVDSVKLLGLNIFSDLTWNIHWPFLYMRTHYPSRQIMRLWPFLY